MNEVKLLVFEATKIVEKGLRKSCINLKSGYNDQLLSMRRNFISLTLIICAFCVLIWLLSPKWYLLHPDVKIKASFRKELALLGSKAIASLDVPVGAILVYHDSIIGSGYNTVNKNHDAGGHAEINAISDALQRLGTEQFRLLDHSQLV